MICGGAIDGLDTADVECITRKIEDAITFACMDEDNKWMFLNYDQAEYMLDEGYENIYPITEWDLDLIVGVGDNEDDEELRIRATVSIVRMKPSKTL